MVILILIFFTSQHVKQRVLRDMIGEQAKARLAHKSSAVSITCIIQVSSLHFTKFPPVSFKMRYKIL